MKSPVIVFQMGKVGSKSIELSLAREDVEDVFHLHHLDTFGGVVFPDKEIRSRKQSQYTISYARKVKAVMDAADNVKVISLVRDPVSRNISAFFQNLERFDVPGDVDASSIDLILRLLLKKYKHIDCLSWFDINFKRFLGLDIYEHRFDHELKRLSFTQGRYDVLILRTEDDDSFKESALQEFMRMPRLKVCRDNKTKDKGGGINELYKAVRQNIRFEESLLDTIYESKLVRHFYTQEELRGFRKYWERD